jgi:hypothetical protein
MQDDGQLSISWLLRPSVFETGRGSVAREGPALPGHKVIELIVY